MNIEKAINFLEEKIKEHKIKDSSSELPEEIFLFVSRITPIVNVDLLIKDEKGRTLLSWRDDSIYGKGWHVPGGVIRYKENMIKRVQEVAKTEIGAKIKFESTPIAVNEVIEDYNTRGHGISILYKGFLSSKFIPENKNLIETEAGYLKWHDFCPKNLLKAHEIYRKYI